MADIFREVDEDVRRDRANELWRKNQKWLLLVAALIVAATAGWRLYDDARVKAAEEAGAKYEAAVRLGRDGKSKESLEALQDFARTAPPGYRLVARMRAASELAALDPAAAVKAYDDIAADPAAGAAFRDVSRLRAAMLRLDQADAREISNRLEATAQGGGEFRNSARELLALAAIKREDMATAARWLDAIVIDPAASQSQRGRAETLMALVGPAARSPK